MDRFGTHGTRGVNRLGGKRENEKTTHIDMVTKKYLEGKLDDVVTKKYVEGKFLKIPSSEAINFKDKRLTNIR